MAGRSGRLEHPADGTDRSQGRYAKNPSTPERVAIKGIVVGRLQCLRLRDAPRRQEFDGNDAQPGITRQSQRIQPSGDLGLCEPTEG